MASGRDHRVIALVYDGVALFELRLVVGLFGRPHPPIAKRWYELSLCSMETDRTCTTGPITINAKRGLRGLDRASTVVIPGWRDPDELPPRLLVDALRKAHARGARLISLCSGAFVLAAAGLLDGKTATTHWKYAESLRHNYPAIRLEPNVLYTDEGQVLTSAGSAAGIDLCLYVVRCDFGAEVANFVARQLVVPPHREGGQSQYVREPVPSRNGSKLAPVMEWAISRLGRRITVDSLAAKANMSLRTFARKFVQETGSTPHRWLTHQRLLAAQRRLETSNEPIDLVAEAVGFDTGMTLRHHFRRALGTTPTAYRRRFSEFLLG